MRASNVRAATAFPFRGGAVLTAIVRQRKNAQIMRVWPSPAVAYAKKPKTTPVPKSRDAVPATANAPLTRPALQTSVRICPAAYAKRQRTTLVPKSRDAVRATAVVQTRNIVLRTNASICLAAYANRDHSTAVSKNQGVAQVTPIAPVRKNAKAINAYQAVRDLRRDRSLRQNGASGTKKLPTTVNRVRAARSVPKDFAHLSASTPLRAVHAVVRPIYVKSGTNSARTETAPLSRGCFFILFQFIRSINASDFRQFVHAVFYVFLFCQAIRFLLLFLRIRVLPIVGGHGSGKLFR